MPALCASRALLNESMLREALLHYTASHRSQVQESTLHTESCNCESAVTSNGGALFRLFQFKTGYAQQQTNEISASAGLSAMKPLGKRQMPRALPGWKSQFSQRGTASMQNKIAPQVPAQFSVNRASEIALSSCYSKRPVLWV